MSDVPFIRYVLHYIDAMTWSSHSLELFLNPYVGRIHVLWLKEITGTKGLEPGVACEEEILNYSSTNFQHPLFPLKSLFNQNMAKVELLSRRGVALCTQFYSNV